MATPVDGVLQRHGTYEIREAKGSNPLPPRPVPGDKLAAYWQGLVMSWEGMVGKRISATKDMQAAWSTDDLGSSRSAMLARYSYKIQIKCTEAVLELVHRFIAPPGTPVCDGSCPHVRAGPAPEHTKRFLDAMDAALTSLREEIKHGDPNHPTYADTEDEHDVYRSARKAFAAIVPRF